MTVARLSGRVGGVPGTPGPFVIVGTAWSVKGRADPRTSSLAAKHKLLKMCYGRWTVMKTPPKVWALVPGTRECSAQPSRTSSATASSISSHAITASSALRSRMLCLTHTVRYSNVASHSVEPAEQHLAKRPRPREAINSDSNVSASFDHSR